MKKENRYTVHFSDRTEIVRVRYHHRKKVWHVERFVAARLLWGETFERIGITPSEENAFDVIRLCLGNIRSISSTP